MSYDPGQLYYDPILTGFSIGFQDQNLYGELLAPPTPVRQQSGRYRVFDRSHWLIHDDIRAPGTAANEIGGRKWSEDTFKVEEHSLQAVVVDEEHDTLLGQGGIADPVFGGVDTVDPDQDAAEDTTGSIQRKHEKLVADIFRDTSNYPGGNVVTLTSGAGTQWSDYTGGVNSTSDPVANIKLAIQTIFQATRRWPNMMIIPFDAIGIIENHPRVVGRYQYTSVMDPNAWRVMLGLPAGVADGIQVFVVDSVYNAADNVDATEDIQSFWGTDIWLGVTDKSLGQRTKTFAKTFYWPYQGRVGELRTVDRWRDEEIKSNKVRTSSRYDVKVVSGVAGYLFKTAVAAIS